MSPWTPRAPFDGAWWYLALLGAALMLGATVHGLRAQSRGAAPHAPR